MSALPASGSFEPLSSATAPWVFILMASTQPSTKLQKLHNSVTSLPRTRTAQQPYGPGFSLSSMFMSHLHDPTGNGVYIMLFIYQLCLALFLCVMGGKLEESNKPQYHTIPHPLSIPIFDLPSHPFLRSADIKPTPHCVRPHYAYISLLETLDVPGGRRTRDRGMAQS